jgi:tRNA-dihydrouridine synthase B
METTIDLSIRSNSGAPTVPTLGTVKTLRIGSVVLPSRYMLAPLAGYTNLAFRSVVRELGGLGLATTDLVNARALLRASRKTMELIQTNAQDRPLAIQIYGSDGAELAEGAKWLEHYGTTTVDINMGCPVNKVTKGGGGSALMCDAVGTVRTVRAVVDAVRIPVTVKMRLGWDEETLSAPFFAREFEKAGVAAVTIHGRTRAQAFSGKVNLDGIRAVVEAVEQMPVIGNGDIRTLDDALHMLHYTGCAGIAMGRGALLNPWIFNQLCRIEQTGTPGPKATYSQRLEVMHRHFHRLVEQRGEVFGCLSFRKVANWYCKVMKPGREVQQQLVQISSTQVFDRIVEQLRDVNQARAHEEWHSDASIEVPRGPMEHW